MSVAPLPDDRGHPSAFRPLYDCLVHESGLLAICTLYYVRCRP